MAWPQHEESAYSSSLAAMPNHHNLHSWPGWRRPRPAQLDASQPGWGAAAAAAAAATEWYLIHSCSLPHDIYYFIFDLIRLLINHFPFIWYLYKRSLFQTFKYNIGTKPLMPKCFYHKTTFLDTHRHFRQAIEFSSKSPIVCGGLELTKIQKEQLKNKHVWIRSLCYVDLCWFRLVRNMHIYIYIYVGHNENTGTICF